MKYEISLLNERAQYVIDEFKNSPSKVKVIPPEADDIRSIDGRFTILEITIDGSTDLLFLFHAGTAVGRDAV